MGKQGIVFGLCRFRSLHRLVYRLHKPEEMRVGGAGPGRTTESVDLRVSRTRLFYWFWSFQMIQEVEFWRTGGSLLFSLVARNISGLSDVLVQLRGLWWVLESRASIHCRQVESGDGVPQVGLGLLRLGVTLLLVEP